MAAEHEVEEEPELELVSPLARQLEEVIRDRDVITQAKGILMASQGITAEQALELLRRASQFVNIELRDVAQAINDGRILPIKRR